jgi:hypothetical protein
MASLPSIATIFLRVARWWFAVTYLAAGVGGFIAGPIMIGLGNYGGLYMIVGGLLLLAMGWLVHPWGLQRALNRQPVPLRR